MLLVVPSVQATNCAVDEYVGSTITSLTEGVKTEFTSTGLSNVVGERAHIAVFTTGPYLGKALITGQDTGNTIKMLDLATGTQDTSWVMGSASTAAASSAGCSGTSCRFQNINFMCLNHDETKLFVGMSSFGRVINYIDIASKTMIDYLKDNSGSLIYFDTFNNAGACAMREAGKLWITRVSYVYQYTSSTYTGAGEYADYSNWVHSDTVIVSDVRGFYLSPDSTTMYLGQSSQLRKAVADSNGDFYDTTVVTNSLTVGQMRSLAVSSDQTTAYVGWDSGSVSKIGKVDLVSASSSSATGVDLNWVTDVVSTWALALSADEQYLYSISSSGTSNWEINSISTGVSVNTVTCTACPPGSTTVGGPVTECTCEVDTYQPKQCAFGESGDCGNPYVKVFDGECGGSEIRMFEGNGDNEGTYEERVKACSEACLRRHTALSGSWVDFEMQGFIRGLLPRYAPMKYVPNLHFERDEQVAYGTRVVGDLGRLVEEADARALPDPDDDGYGS